MVSVAIISFIFCGFVCFIAGLYLRPLVDFVRPPDLLLSGIWGYDKRRIFRDALGRPMVEDGIHMAFLEPQGRTSIPGTTWIPVSSAALGIWNGEGGDAAQ